MRNPSKRTFCRYREDVKRLCGALFVSASLLAACGGGASPPSPPCGPPPPSAAPQLSLVYPAPGAANVSTAVGMVIFAGYPGGLQIAMRSSTGSAVPLGPPSAAPSPLPTPNAAPTGIAGVQY